MSVDDPRVYGPFREPTYGGPAVLGVVLAGSYLHAINDNIIGVALPSMAKDLGTNEGSVDWVVTSYILAMVSIQLCTGWLALRFGHKNVFILAMSVFVLGSFLSALAPTLLLLVLARVVQGLGGGILVPLGIAMIFVAFPAHRRGSALAAWGLGIVAAPAISPAIGGWITSSVSWRWIFVLLGILGLLALPIAVRILRDTRRLPVGTFDWLGWSLAVFGVVGLILLSRYALSWDLGPAVLLLAILAVGLSLVALVLRSLRRPQPLIQFRIFRTPSYSIVALVIVTISIASVARSTFLPVELQVIRGMSARDVGLVLLPAAIGAAITMPIGAWLSDRIGAKLPAAIGLTVLTGSMLYLGRLELDTPLLSVLFLLGVHGLGLGLANLAATNVGLASLRGEFVAQGSSMLQLSRQASAAGATAILTAVVASSLGSLAPTVPSDVQSLQLAQNAYNGVFNSTIIPLSLAAGLALLLPGRQRMKALQGTSVEQRS